MEHESDGALVAAFLAGDRAALAALYDRYADALHRFCRSVLRDPDEAADAVHDTFLIAARSLDRLRDPERLRPWLYAVARHEAIRRGRTAARSVPTGEMGERSSEAPPPEDTVKAEEAARLVWDAASGLGERDRTLLALHVREGLEGDDLASAIGVRTGTVYMMVNRLKAQVERAIGALLLARTAGGECAELRDMLAGWDGSFSPLIRKRVARHADGCQVCGDRRRTLASPLALLAATPSLPAPAALRQRVLDDIELASSVGGRGPALGRDGFPRPKAPWHEVAAAVVVGAVVGGGVVLGVRVADDRSVDPSGGRAPSVTATTMATAASSGAMSLAGGFTRYPGTPPSTPSPNRVSLTLPASGGAVTGTSEWAVDAGRGATTVTGVWSGGYDAATGRLSGSAEITTTGPGGDVLGSGTAPWSATYDPETGTVEGALESDDGPWEFRASLT